MTVTCYIGLGSNLSNHLGSSQDILRDAVLQLRQIGSVAVSSLYQSPPMGPQDQPDYFNAVARLDCNLAPLDLLDALQGIEQHAGRVRLRHWGERSLDLDLLLYGEQQLHLPRLTVPHVGLLQRDFVVLPLLDLDANLKVNGQALQGLFDPLTSSLRRVAAATWAD